MVRGIILGLVLLTAASTGCERSPLKETELAGSGGAPGTGGVPGIGGSPGIGGAPGTGGAFAGTGGIPGTGGNTGVGGARGTGGASGTGGAATGGASGASGSILQYSITLDAIQDGTNAPGDGGPTSSGHGTAIVTLSPMTGACTVTGTFQGLTGPAVAAHIHGLAPAGMNAAVILLLTVTNAVTDASVGSGTFSGSGVLSTVGIDGGLTQVAGMIAGLTYLNIHTATFPAGEIRGQIH